MPSPRWNPRVAALSAAGLLSAVSATADLEQRSFLRLADPPANWVPPTATEVVSAVVARPDGLVFVAGWNAGLVHVIDARDPGAPRLVCQVGVGNSVDGLALDGDRLWIGGDDADVDADGLAVVPIPADPFTVCPGPIAFVAGVSSGVTPCVFSAACRKHVLVANRWGFPVSVVDAATRAVVGTWSPTATGATLADASVGTTASGQVLALLPALKSGIFVVDLTVPSRPMTVASFDWTFAPADTDGDPFTSDPCERNGDGDSLECGESGRAGDGRRLNFANRAVLARAGGVDYVVASDGSTGGHVQVWALADILAACPGEGNCASDASLNPASGPPWPDVDVVPLMARYRLAKCPLAVENFAVEDGVVFVAYYEEGAHVIDLAAQGLPPSAAGLEPIELAALASFDTLPADSDTVLENYPCHPLMQADGCESQNADWNPTPCQPAPPPGAAFRVVRNAGLRSATDVEWSGCRLYVSDQGTPDADELPTHVGEPQGLHVLEMGGPFPGDVGPSLAVTRDPTDPGAVLLAWGTVALSPAYRVHRGTIPEAVMTSYDHSCVASVSAPAARLAGEITTDPGSPLPDRYYLVGASCESFEGVLGPDSRGLLRPQSATACP